MRVFVTGASGWVGSAVVPELLAAGHEVVGLARSDEAAAALQAAGASVRRGTLDDLDALRGGAAEADGVIHLAFIHDLSQYDAANAVDQRAIEAMGAALAGSDRPLVIASGVTAAPGRTSTEDDPADPGFPRSLATTMTLDLAQRGVRSAVVRLPPTTHGAGDNGFMTQLAATARQRGVAGYVGDGANAWPAVHRSDAARVFRLALEVAPAGSVWHAVGEEGVATRAIAEKMGRRLGVPAASVATDDALEHFGWLGALWGAHVPTSSALTQERLGWTPTGPTLLEDLEADHYLGDG